MKTKTEKILAQLRQSQTILQTATEALIYCNDNGTDNYHIFEFLELAEEKLKNGINELDILSDKF